MAEAVKPFPPGELPAAADRYVVGREPWDYTRVLVRRWKWVALGVAVFVFLALAYNALARPVWGARASLLVTLTAPGRGRPTASDLTSFLPNPLALAAMTELETQVAILNSRPLRELALLLLENKRDFVRSVTTGQRARVTTNDLRELLRESQQLRKNWRPSEAAGRKMGAAVTVAAIPSTSIIQIRAVGTDAERAHDVANALSLAYLLGALERTQAAAQSLLEYVSVKLQESEKRLRQAEAAVAAFNSRVGSVDLPVQAKTEIERAASLRQQLLEVRKDLEAKRAQLADMERQVARQQGEVVQNRTIVRNPMLEALQRQLGDLTVERNALLGKYTENSTRVRAVDSQIAAVKAQIARQAEQVTSATTRAVNPLRAELLSKIAVTRAEIKAAEKAVGPLNKAVAEAEKRLAAMPSNQVELGRLQRELQLAEQQYLMLRQKEEEYRLAQESQISGAELLEPAVLASQAPISPRKKLNLLVGLVAGLVFGLALAVVAEYIDQTYDDAGAAERDLGLSLLGSVPKISRPGLASPDDAHRPFRESFLSLWANIGFAAPGGPPGSIVVTSSQAGEGKTTLAANLAVAAAETERQVVVLDADLRHPRLHELFGLPQSPGLSSVLTGQATLEECLQEAAVSPGRRVMVLTAGPCPPTPPALLDSLAMDSVLKELRGRGWIVLVDAPPLGEMSDAQILGSKAEAVLLVFTQRGTRRHLLRAARVLLARAGANVVGLVMNRALQPRSGLQAVGFVSEGA